LLRDKLHGTLNLWEGALAAVAYVRSSSQSLQLQDKKCTHVRDHLEYMGWHKGCGEMGFVEMPKVDAEFVMRRRDQRDSRLRAAVFGGV